MQQWDTSAHAVAITREDPRQAELAALVAALDRYHAALYPPASNHNLDLATLARPDVRFMAARQAGIAVGCGALRLRGDYGEVKRMYVCPGARGRHNGVQILAALEAEARSARLRWLRLETGVAQHAALALYERAGFRDRTPFGDYLPDPLSRFLEKPLD